MRKLVNGIEVEMSPEEEESFLEQQAIDVAEVIVPQIVTMRQARLALLAGGLLDNVETAIAGMSSPAKEQVEIEWNYSNAVERGNSFVSTLAGALGLSEKDLDDLFIVAATL